MTDAGELHDDPKFGKAPEPLIHDLDITDGAVRLYAHMHWRYGKNKRNFEGQKSIGVHLDISRTTVRNRIDELVAKDWIVIVSRDFNPKTGNYMTPYYHVFTSQDDCRKWRDEYKPAAGETVEPRPEARKRVSRKGKGGKPTNLPRANSGEHGHANSSSHGGANSGLHGDANSGEHGHANPGEHELDSSYLDSIDLDSKGAEAIAPPLKLVDSPSKNKDRKPKSTDAHYYALIKAFGLDISSMTRTAKAGFAKVAQELIEINFSVDEIPALHDYVKNLSLKEGWKKQFTPFALSQQVPYYLKHKAVMQRRKEEQDWENGVGKPTLTEEQQKQMADIFEELDNQFSGKKVSA